MSEPLFRDEALAFQRDRAFGDVVIARSPSRNWLTALAAGAAVALVTWALRV